MFDFVAVERNAKFLTSDVPLEVDSAS